MRLPINRGIPSTGLQFTALLPGEAFKVTVFARCSDLSQTLTLTRQVDDGTNGNLVMAQLPSIAIGDYTAQTNFEGIVLRRGSASGDANPTLSVAAGAGVTRGFIYGYYETAASTGQQPNIPFIGSRQPAPDYNIYPINVNSSSPEVLVHTLDKNYVDLVTIQAIVPTAVELQFRFYDGSFTGGLANYKAFTLPATSGTETLLSSHPMRGPGKITVIRGADAVSDPCVVYGSYFRNG